MLESLLLLTLLNGQQFEIAFRDDCSPDSRRPALYESLRQRPSLDQPSPVSNVSDDCYQSLYSIDFHERFTPAKVDTVSSQPVLHAFQYTPPQPVGTWGYGIPPAIRMTGQAEPPKLARLDLALTVTSLSASAIATGITAACTSTNTCVELNPVLRKWIGESITKAVVLKSTINGAVHFLVLRFVPEGKWRTLALAGITGINVFDAAHDILEMRKITKFRP